MAKTLSLKSTCATLIMGVAFLGTLFYYSQTSSITTKDVVITTSSSSNHSTVLRVDNLYYHTPGFIVPNPKDQYLQPVSAKEIPYKGSRARANSYFGNRAGRTV